MSRRLLGGVAVRLYPKAIRDSRGGEILGTLLDAGEESLLAFVRQLASLIAGGVVARSRRALTGPPAKLAASAISWAAIILLTRFPFGQGVRVLYWPLGFTLPLVTVRDMVVLPLIVLASFTLGGRRLAGLLGLVWVALFVREYGYPGVFRAETIGMAVLPAAGFGLLTWRPQAAPAAWQTRTLWLVPAAALALVTMAVLRFSPYSGQSVTVLIPVVAALVFLPVAPGFAIGTALAWSAQWAWIFGSESTWTIALLASTPVALALVGAGRYAATHSYD
jgi:hypothetical protein